MDSNVGQAFYDVYFSLKEILRKKQRHLYCNMLDLLFTTCKTTTSSAILKKITFDELVLFWVDSILPLLFDKDKSIQKSAVLSMEQGLLMLDLSNIHNCSQWADIKNNIIKVQAPLIHKLREERNPYWHRVWCLLFRILDREILKSASTINSFLSIVELGFRNPDNNVRAEAFSCWRLLIEVFATHNQLTSPKRLKLICIPLKSSQSKTAHAAIVKLRIWWYLIKCMEHNLDQHYDNVIEPFLTFCFGSELKRTQGVAQQYSTVSALAIPCFAALISTESNEYIHRLLRANQLEELHQPSPLTGNKILGNIWKPLAYGSLESIRLLIRSGISYDADQMLLSVLMKSLTISMSRLDLGQFYSYCSDGLVEMIAESFGPVTLMINTIATEGVQLTRSLRDFKNYRTLIESLIKILTAGKTVGFAIRQNFMRQIFCLEPFIPEKHVWNAVATVAEYLFETKNDDFETKLQIWCQISSTVIDFAKEDKLGCSLEQFHKVLVPWTLWPLKLGIEFVGKCNLSHFDKPFHLIWKGLLYLSENTSGRSQHLIELKETLHNLLKANCEEVVFIEFLEGYINEILKMDCSSSQHYENVLELIIETLRKYQLQREKILIILRNVLRNLRANEINRYAPLIRTAIEFVVRNAANGSLHSTFIEEWKNSVLSIVRSYSDKSFIKQISDLLKESNSFVIIPSVWSLKPDKLTERQKERIAEKTNIPALYNDMSQSLDNYIKPWTPRKIVIAKEDQNEIILDGTPGLQNENCFTDKCDSDHLNASDQTFRSANISSSSKIFSYKETNPVVAPVCVPESSTVTKILNVESSVNNTDVNNPENSSEIENKTIENAQHITSSKINSILLSHAEKKSCLKQNVSSGLLDSNEINNEQKLKDPIPESQEQHMEADTNSTLDPELPKELSPKKTMSKGVLLSSPPDRRSINNTSSPKIRPKPAAHLTGRGAQLINMIRNKKVDTPQSIQTPISKILSNKSENVDRIVTPELDLIRAENTSTPLHTKDLLTFTKRLPSPSASPSTSILKRNLRRESLEDINFDSPACKKKRVSFHDPPVSVTKEYIKHFDENKSKPKRCLILDKNQQSSEKSFEVRCALKRRSKLDSICEIEKFAHDGPKVAVLSNDQNIESASVADNTSTSQNKGCLNDNMECTNVLHNDSTDDLNYVVQKYTLDEVLEKFVDIENESKTKSVNTMAKIISRYMRDNIQIKENVLEALSESHSKDFLDHAVRENLSSVVCDRLNLQSVIEYVCEKSKINSFCRSSLLNNIPEVLRQCKQNCERMSFIKSILESTNLNDSNILDLIGILLQKRSTSDAEVLLNVSEPAIDSSSNL